MNPVVGLWVAPMALPAMHNVEWMSFLKDEHAQPCIFHLWQGACGPATDATLARLAL